jgi:putative transposase
MPRHLRVQFPGALYHVTARGNGRQRIFRDVRDRERFLARLGESVDTYGVRLYVFCLMVNHYHLVVETPQANLSRFMQSLETGYTVYFNLRHDSCGHLTQGRYGAKLVGGDSYLLRLARYVQLNPVFVGRTEHLPVEERIARLRRYRWSSYPSYVGESEPLDFVDYEPLLALVGGQKGKRRVAAYRRFVETGVAQADAEFSEALELSARSIGDEEFRAWVDERYDELLSGVARKEDVAFRRQCGYVSADRVLAMVGEAFSMDEAGLCRRRRGCPARAVASKMLCRYGGLTRRDAAGRLGLRSGQAVTWQISKLAALCSDPENRDLSCQVRSLEGALRAEAQSMLS